jgi:hypothetical protein
MVEVQAFMAAERRLSTEQRALMAAGTSVAEGIRALAVVAGNITDDVGANVHTRAGREISLRRFEEFFLRDGSGEDGLVLQ